MKDKLIKIFRIMTLLFIFFSILALVFQLIYLISEGSNELVFVIFIGPIITFFYRFAMAGFFYLFSMFYEDWSKTE
jgi:hypothetical protein